jgi:methylated-DNA-[protein]-cysteine S-methyltransferase
MRKIIIKTYSTPAGEVLLGAFNDKLCLADWKYRKMRKQVDSRIQEGLNAEYKEGNADVLEQAEQELEAYFSGGRREFDVPMLWVGTDFQKKVWNALTQIPFGQTETYLGLSRLLGNEKAIRAIATANGANAISILVPCHRIIGSNGDLVGYAGGLPAKKKLLKLEGADVFSQLELF